MRNTLLVLIVAVALVGVAGAASGQVAEVGLSGQCYNADASEGGQDTVSVDSDGNVVLPSDGDPDALLEDGAVPALVLFATESVNDGGNTGNACKHDHPEGDRDYLEVHARAGSVFVQVCYNGAVTANGECPTEAPGPE